MTSLTEAEWRDLCAWRETLRGSESLYAFCSGGEVVDGCTPEHPCAYGLNYRADDCWDTFGIRWGRTTSDCSATVSDFAICFRERAMFTCPPAGWTPTAECDLLVLTPLSHDLITTYDCP